ncbi:MAG: hypothetical protein KY455_10820 [Euryarchaeota archaeon]|nr:hypothetical protein [Euryarchaeota archaeon]
MRIRTANLRMLVILAAVLIAPLSGCFSDDKAKPSDDAADGVTVDAPPEAKTEETGEVIKDHTNSADPKAHFHHLWNGREEVILWKDSEPVEFKTMDFTFVGEYRSMTWAEFDLEDDGDDNSDPLAADAAPKNVADVVFAGTDYIEATFPDRFFDGVGKLSFFWKPANTNTFGGGITVNPEDVVRIHLGQTGMADPAHQNAVSRWKFRLVAFETNEVCELGGDTTRALCPPAMATEAPTDPENPTLKMGGFGMIAHNGGTESLDPPHPDFWGSANTLVFKTIEREVTDPVVQTPVVREKSPLLTDIAPLPGDVVPMGTERVEVTVDWEASQAPDNFLLKLRYHGADDIDYIDAQPKDGTEKTGASPDGGNTYVIYNVEGGKDLGLVDPPYEARSFWRFEVVPSLMDPQNSAVENAGVFQGSFSISVKVFKQEGFVLT